MSHTVGCAGANIALRKRVRDGPRRTLRAAHICTGRRTQNAERRTQIAVAVAVASAPETANARTPPQFLRCGKRTPLTLCDRAVAVAAHITHSAKLRNAKLRNAKMTQRWARDIPDPYWCGAWSGDQLQGAHVYVRCVDVIADERLWEGVSAVRGALSADPAHIYIYIVRHLLPFGTSENANCPSLETHNANCPSLTKRTAQFVHYSKRTTQFVHHSRHNLSITFK